MKHLLRILSVAVFLGANLLWFLRGANHGWTKTRVPVTTLDTVTGLTGITYEPRFVPGLDFLALAVAVTLALFVASFFFNHKHTTNT